MYFYSESDKSLKKLLFPPTSKEVSAVVSAAAWWDGVGPEEGEDLVLWVWAEMEPYISCFPEIDGP